MKTNSALAEIFIEFKWDPTDDPFCDVFEVDHEYQSFLRETKAAHDTLGQITSYAAAQLGAQFRTHVYSVFILRDTARILRWDRTGTIVTEAIKYNKFDILAEFFARYSKAPPAMCGKDDSASDPTDAEKHAAREALQLEKTVPLVKLSIPDADGGTRYFVTSTPVASLYTPPGAPPVASKPTIFCRGQWFF